MKTVSYIRKITDRVLEYLDELGFVEALAKQVASEIQSSAPPELARAATYGQPKPPADLDDLKAQVTSMFAVAPDRYLTGSTVARAIMANFNDVKSVLDRMTDDGTLRTSPGRRGGVRYWIKGRGPKPKSAAVATTPMRDALLVALRSGGFESADEIATALEKRRFVKSEVLTEINRMAAKGHIVTRTIKGETSLTLAAPKEETEET